MGGAATPGFLAGARQHLLVAGLGVAFTGVPAPLAVGAVNGTGTVSVRRTEKPTTAPDALYKAGPAWRSMAAWTIGRAHSGVAFKAWASLGSGNSNSPRNVSITSTGSGMS